MSNDFPATAYVLWFGPNALTIARSLGRRSIPVIGVHDDDNEPCTSTRYARVKILPDFKTNELVWLNWLLAEGKRNTPRKSVLLVCSDRHWMFVARHRRKLERYFLFPLPQKGNPEDWMKKSFQYDAACRAGIPCPQRIYPRTLEDVEHEAYEVPYPCIVKPVLSHEWAARYGRKLTFVRSPQELLSVSADALGAGLEFIIQEFIPAQDEDIFGCFSYTDASSRPLGWCVSRKLRQYEPRFGSSCYSRSVDAPEVVELATTLLKSMGFHGISSVEFKRDPRDGVFKLMEINVRAPLMTPVAVDSGVDLPYLAYRDLIGDPIEAPPAELGHAVGFLAHDLHSERFYRQCGQLTRIQWLKSWLKAREIHFAWDDLRPMRGYLHGISDHWRRGRYFRLPKSLQMSATLNDLVPSAEDNSVTTPPRQSPKKAPRARRAQSAPRAA